MDKYEKLLLNHYFKTYEIMQVSKLAFENSQNIESVGSMEGIKIKNEEHKAFLIEESLKLNYKLEV